MSRFVTSSAELIRPANATAYGAGDLMAGSTTAANVVPMWFPLGHMCKPSGLLRTANLFKDDTTTTAASFRLHLFTVDPGTLAAGDNDAFAVPAVEERLGSIDVDMSSGAWAGTDGLWDSAAFSPEIPFEIRWPNASDWGLFGLMQAVGAYAPASGERFLWALGIET